MKLDLRLARSFKWLAAGWRNRRPRAPGVSATALWLCLVTACAEPQSYRVPLPAKAPARTLSGPKTPAKPFYPALAWRILPSGLLLLLEEDMYTDVVGVVGVVRGGASADPVGSEGLAHLVEHLTFRARDPKPMTPLPLAASKPATKSATRWDTLLHLAAAESNALTTQDCMVFYEFGPVSRLQWLLELEAARLADPLAGVDETAFATELRTVATEQRLRTDPRVGSWATNTLFPLMFPAEHPYARPVGGSPTTLGRMTLKEARAFAAQNFRPERMTLLVTAPSASTSIASIVEQLPKSLVGDAKHPVPREKIAAGPEPRIDTPGGSVIKQPSHLPVPQLWIGWTLPGGYGPFGPTERLLKRWVEADLALDQLRQEDAHIRHVGTYLQSGQRASALFVQVLLSDGADPDRISQIVAGRVASLWAREPTERPQIGLLRAGFATQAILSEPWQVPRALDQALLSALTERPELLMNVIGSVADVQSSNLAQFAYKHLTQERAHSMMFTPDASLADLSTPRRDHGRPGSEAMLASRHTAKDGDDSFAAAANWDLMELPGVRSPARKVVVKTLSTGLTLVVAKRQSTAAVAWLGFHGGYSDANPPLLAELARRTRPDAVEAPKQRMLSDRGVTRDASIESMEFLPSDSKAALQLLFAKAATPVKTWPARDALERMLASVDANIDPAWQKADRAFARALFGEHAHARMVDIGDVAKLTRADVDVWVGRVHNAKNAVLVVVGDVDSDEVERGAETLSRQWSTPTWVELLPVLPPPPLQPATTEHLTLVVTPRLGGQVEVRMGCLLPPIRAADRGYLEFLRLAIQERLNSALRIDRGEGYGTVVGTDWLRGGTAALQMATSLDVERLDEGLATIRKHWQRWSRDGFDPGEINVARWRFAGSLPLARLTGHALAYQLFSEWNVEPAALANEPFQRRFRIPHGWSQYAQA